jgi:hypothetical protein
VAPYKVKLAVLYGAMGLLGILFALSVLRLAIFTAIWVLTGRSIWLLPNLYSDDVPIGAILSPVWGEDKPKSGAGPPLLRRLAVAGATAALVMALYRATPEGKGVVNNLKGANKSILEMLNLHEAPKSIGAGAGGGGVVMAGGAGGAAAGAGAGGAAAGATTLPPPNAATAAAQAVARGVAGPAGTRQAEEELMKARLANVAPIPDDPDAEEALPAPPADAAAEAQPAEAAAADAAADAAAEEAEAAAAAGAEAGAAAAAGEVVEGAAETAAEL